MKIDSGVRGWCWSIWPVLIVAGLSAGGLAVGCSSSNKQPPTIQCLLASDCKDVTKQCIQNYCVSMCTTSQDCPSGQRCVKYADTLGAGGAGGAAGDSGLGGAGGMSVDVPVGTTGNICQVPEVKTCAMNSDCTPGLFCAKDLQCRNMCNADVDCLGGISTSTPPKCTTSHYCVDPVADASNYDPTTNDFKPNAGVGGTTGTGGGGGIPGGAGGKGGATVVKPSFAFSKPVQGDINPYFVAGVAARVQDRLLIFSGYTGPPVALGATGAGGAGGASSTTANYVFLQTFDATTGTAMGPATALFQAQDGNAFNLWNVAVSSGGDVALLYGTGNGQTFNTNLYVAFIATSAAGAALPAPGVQMNGSVAIESTGAGDVSAFWSEANQEFVFSWKYNTNGWQIRTKKFLTDGSPAGGDSGAVNVVSSIDDYGWQQGMGASGNLFAVASRVVGAGFPFLALLDTNGNAVGTPVQVNSNNVVGRWINVGGTTNGFVVLYQDYNAAKIDGVYIPKLPDGSGIVPPPAGAGGAGGDSGAGAAGGSSGWNTFSINSTATGYDSAYTVSDELGAGGTGTLYLETNGASFVYVEADGKTLHSVGTVISSSMGSWISITNYRGSFSVSLFEGTRHATQAAVSR